MKEAGEVPGVARLLWEFLFGKPLIGVEKTFKIYLSWYGTTGGHGLPGKRINL
jgi:hypothetical protein